MSKTSTNTGNRSLELCKRVVTTESFVMEAKEIYGCQYDYCKVNYINKEHPVLITCPKHGDFSIFAREHLDGKGCPKCKKEEKFIIKMKEKYGDKFDLSKVSYIDSQTPVEVICPQHGSFFRTTNAVLNSRYGCPTCGTQQADQYKETLHQQALLLHPEKNNKQDRREKVQQIVQQEVKKMEDTIIALPQKKKKVQMQLPSSFVSIDFETLYPQRVSACSIGMVKYQEGKIVDRYYSLIRPPFNYPQKKGVALTWIHGFTEDNFLNERTMAELMPEIEAFIGEFPLVAHNAQVEKACFSQTIEYYGLTTKIDYKNFFDTLTISYLIEEKIGIDSQGSGKHVLDMLCEKFNVPILNHHNALSDAEMCGNLMMKFAEILETDSTIGEIKQIDNITPTKRSKKYNEEDVVQRMDLESIIENPFKGRKVVLTGFPEKQSVEYGHILHELGAKICQSVSSKTDYLICGETPGPSKMKKAHDFGTKILSKEEFEQMVSNS